MTYLQVESELSELPYEDRFEFLKSLGVSESGLGSLIRATYSLLGLRTYFTSGEKVMWRSLYYQMLYALHILKQLSSIILCRKQKHGPYLQVSFCTAACQRCHKMMITSIY